MATSNDCPHGFKDCPCKGAGHCPGKGKFGCGLPLMNGDCANGCRRRRNRSRYGKNKRMHMAVQNQQPSFQELDAEIGDRGLFDVPRFPVPWADDIGKIPKSMRDYLWDQLKGRKRRYALYTFIHWIRKIVGEEEINWDNASVDTQHEIGALFIAEYVDNKREDFEKLREIISCLTENSKMENCTPSSA